MPSILRLLSRLSVLWLLALGAGLALPARAAAGPAGEVTFTLGLVTATAEAPAATSPFAPVDPARAAGQRALKVGDKVHAGERLATGPGGHLHIRTVDGGLLALRPDTRARIEIYDYDAAQPGATRIRLALESGVMRAASGSGAQAARDKFRLNTPVAAIGIRGTDFTVSATEDQTRVVVQQGAVVVSAFSGECRPEALGPCTGALARALSAEQSGKLLELRRGERQPQLLDLRRGLQSAAPAQRVGSTPAAALGADSGPTAASGSNVAGPGAGSAPAAPASVDVVAVTAAPSLPDRVPGSAEGALSGQVVALASEARVSAQVAASVRVQQAVVEVLPPQPQATWGRWAPFANSAPASDTTAFRAANGDFAALNGAFVLSLSSPQSLRMPEAGSFDFKLAGQEAWETADGKLVAPASVSDARLKVDFGARSFNTQLTVGVTGQTLNLQSQGRITVEGGLEGVLIYSQPGVNMNVRGTLAGATANRAAYLFDALFSGNRGVVGATSWSR